MFKFSNNNSNTRIDDLSGNDYKQLANLGRELTKELSLEQLLNDVLIVANKLTDSPDSGVILTNSDQTALYFAAATGEDADWVLGNFGLNSEKQIPINGSKAGEVFLSQKPLIENQVKYHYSGVDDQTEKKTKCMVCVPLKVGKQCLGVIQVLNKKTTNYTKRDCQILEYFADYAGIAIRNAKLMGSLLAHSGLYGSLSSAEEMFLRMNELNQDAKVETLTILFVDMRGFTQLCQSLGNPVLLQQKLSEYISLLTQTVLEHSGIVNKYLGDGVMALFQNEDSSVNAIQCAFKMREKFSIMKDKWNRGINQQLNFLDIGIGITTDQVIIGGIGDSDMRDYTVIGTAVNLAHEFEKAARNGKQILCDQLTYLNAQHLIADFDAIEDFLLQKPGQDVGISYNCYHLNSLTSDNQPNLFISHSHKDHHIVKNLAIELQKSNIKTWYSTENIPKGTFWTTEIRKAITKCNWMIVLVTKNSVKSKWISREIDLAVIEEHLQNKIIPIVFEDADLKELNKYLAAMQAIVHDTFENTASNLLEIFNSNSEYFIN